MSVGEFITWLDGLVWGTVMMVLIIVVGILLSVRTKFHPQRRLGLSLRYAVNNEEGAEGDVSSFGALTTALAATVGTGNIVGVSTAIMGGGPGALFWMEFAAFFGIATKYAEGVLAVKYRHVKEDGTILGGPFYYIEKGTTTLKKVWVQSGNGSASCSHSSEHSPVRSVSEHRHR